MTISSCEGASRRRGLWAGLVFVMSVADSFLACGGTSGLEGLPQPGLDASSSDSSADATVSAADGGLAGGDSALPIGDAGSPDLGVSPTGLDAGAVDGTFDADIQYADAARLPDLGTAPVVGEGGVAPAPSPWDLWPPCAPDKPITDDSGDLTGESADDAGFDSGSCSTYSWTRTYPKAAGSGAKDGGGLTCDQCLRVNACGLGISTSALGLTSGVLPPCSDLREAGTAAHGQGAGASLFSLCGKLFECVESTGCYTSSYPPIVQNCYCGTALGAACLQPGVADGLCKKEIEEAFQAEPTTPIPDILGHLTDLSLQTGYAGSEVMTLFDCAQVASPRCDMCFPSGGVDGG